MKTKLLPVNLEIFRDWTFVDGTGNYRTKEACVMSALYLATQIAEGKVTLDQVLNPPTWENGAYKVVLNEVDKVSCVSTPLRSVVIDRNDIFHGNEGARKEWALKLLPRLLGTFLGEKFDQNLKKELYRERPSVWGPTQEEQQIEKLDGDIEWLLGRIEKEKEKRRLSQEKRRATLAAKKAVANG